MAIPHSLPLFLSVALFITQNYLRHQSVESDENVIRKEYDFVVVGSGTAGSAVAARLSQSGANVLLLEAGGPAGGNTDIPGSYWDFFQSQINWNYTQEEQFVGRAFLNQRIPEDKGLVFGGTSTINTMIYNRGNPRDYDTWEYEYGAKGWGFKGVFPYFLKFENNMDPKIASNGWHSTSGPVQITSFAKPPPLMLLHQKAVHEWGFRDVDLNGPSQRGTMIAQAFIDSRGVRSSSSNSYLLSIPNPNPKNLHILLNSYVTRILIEGHRAVGVEFVRNGHKQVVLARKEVIISAGVINSAQLLMLSGIGPKEELSKLGIPVVADLPVGRNLQNHPGITLNHLIKQEYTYLAGDLASSSIAQLNDFYANNQGPMTEHYRTMTYSSSRSNPDPEWPNWDWETGIYLFPQNLSQHVIRYGKRRHEWDVYNTAFLGKPYLLSHTLLNKVRSRGSVHLASADPFHYPIIHANFLQHPQDLEDLIEALTVTIKFFETSSIAKYLVPSRPIPGCQFCAKGFVYECEPYIRCMIEQITDSGYHPVGTARMGDPRRPDVVVDPRLRVKHVDGLRVCDASVMPYITNGNTNGPTHMIGEKCADIVKQDNLI